MAQKKRGKAAERVTVAQPRTLGERLGAEIAYRFGSERAFLRALEKEKPPIRRRSRNTVRRYLRDEVRPPDGWLERVADLLRVRLRWLADEEGGRTVADDVARQARKPDQSDGLTSMLRRRIQCWEDVDDVARAAIAETWRVLATGEDVDGIVEQQGQAIVLRGDAIAQRLGEALDFPLAQLTWRSLEGANHWNAYVTEPLPYKPAGMEYRDPPIGRISVVVPEALSDYVVLMCQAIRQYVVAARKAAADTRSFWERHPVVRDRDERQ